MIYEVTRTITYTITDTLLVEAASESHAEAIVELNELPDKAEHYEHGDLQQVEGSLEVSAGSTGSYRHTHHPDPILVPVDDKLEPLADEEVRRYVGDALIDIRYVSGNEYAGRVIVEPENGLGVAVCWEFSGLSAPPAGLGAGVAYNSPEAFDQMVRSLCSFAGYYTSDNRPEADSEEGQELEAKGWPSPEEADAIYAAVSFAQQSNGDYMVHR